MISKRYKVYYEYINTDRLDIIAGEKSQQEVETDLSNFPTELKFAIDESGKIDVIEENFEEKYIVIEITTGLPETELKKKFNEVLTRRLFLVQEIQ